jgi:SAM-dependent methyltransferase
MTQDLTRQYYELHADEYSNATRDVELTRLWDVMTRELPADALVLDLGCGSGRDIRYFSNLGFRVVGLDYSHRLVTLAKNFSHQPVVLGDIVRLPFADAVFDAVWAIGSLLHIPRSALLPTLKQIRRILKAEGQFVASMKKGEGEVIDRLGRRNVFYQSRQWEDLLKDSGFASSHLEEIVEDRQIPVGDRGRITWIMSLTRVIDSNDHDSRDANELLSGVSS